MAFRIPPPKTPTDGTLLTSARKVADDWYQPPPPKQGPQWRLWVNLPAVELWQAITLSCDIEPKYYLGDADPEFQLRMRIAIGNGLGKGDRPHCALVTLTDVACLARRCGWTLPPEFPKSEPVPTRADAAPMPEEAEQQDEVEAAVKKRPGRKPSNARSLLADILNELEHFASNIGEPFDRQAMPGPLGNDWHEEGSFHWLCARIYPAFKKAKSTFEKQRAGLCAVGQYARPTDFYRNALPIIAPKLGCVSDARRSRRQ